MNYTITEDEYNAIDAARSQLNLVAGLLTSTDADRNLFKASDLYEFLAAQIDTLKGVISSVDDRHKAERDENNVLSCIDLMTIIQVVSGRRTLAGGGLKDMSRKLQNCVKANPDMEYVLRAWTEVMTDGNYSIQLERPVPPKPPKSKPLTEKRLFKAMGVANASDYVKKLVAASNGQDFEATANTTGNKPTKRR